MCREIRLRLKKGREVRVMVGVRLGLPPPKKKMHPIG